ncbi:hypothetical protein M2197_008076 [Bradyrhizobium japonicum]|nr:hypothetical protein [Bradyrhizobium japonicum]MCS3991191.1 hypothetical protein [Bradyrhizobium japonicum]MCS4013999.1 hypothetical protein [Bradyrhizobium japonicum]MCS4210004.1 hypothetical protein [Bradyrhizobium japonicum]
MKAKTRQWSSGNPKENGDKAARSGRDRDRRREQAPRILAVGWLQPLRELASRRQSKRVAEHEPRRNACGHKTRDTECSETETSDHERQDRQVQHHGHKEGHRIPRRVTQQIGRSFFQRHASHPAFTPSRLCDLADQSSPLGIAKPG